MTLLEEIRENHKRFHADIARRAALVPQKEELTYSIPNAPFGVRKVRPGPAPKAKVQPNIEPAYWHCMWFFDLIKAKPARVVEPTINQVLDAVSRHYAIPRMALISARRTRNITRPRQISYFLAKKLTGRSFPEIGRRCGGRDHTSVIHGVQLIERLRAVDPLLESDLHAIASSLGGSL
jgi:hypothetical protein